MKRTRGFALALLGTFVFVFASVIMMSYTHQLAYFGVAGLSLGGVVLTYLASKSYSVSRQVLFLVSGSVALASATSSVVLYFPVLEAFAYVLAALLGSFLAMKGVRDIENFVLQKAIPRRRTEIPAVHEGI